MYNASKAYVTICSFSSLHHDYIFVGRIFKSKPKIEVFLSILVSKAITVTLGNNSSQHHNLASIRTAGGEARSKDLTDDARIPRSTRYRLDRPEATKSTSQSSGFPSIARCNLNNVLQNMPQSTFRKSNKPSPCHSSFELYSYVYSNSVNR